MSEQKLRIGVVGLGAFVEIAHFPAYFESPYADFIEVAAFCDRNEERLHSLADRYGVGARFNEHREMLKKTDLEAVVVVTPDHTHTEIVLDSLAAGCDVLVEKPLTMKTAEAQLIARRAAEAGRIVLVDFHKRYDPCHQEARRRILAGRYGPLQFGWAWMQDAISVPAGGFFRSDLARKSSPNWFLGVHFYDLIRYLTGCEPSEVRAVGYSQVLKARGIPTYDAVKADFVFENGAAVTVFTSWNLPESAPLLTRQGIYLQFASGEAEVDSSRRGFVVTEPKEHRFVNPMFLRRTSRGWAGYGVESIGEALRIVHRARRGDRAALNAELESGRLPEAATAEDGVRATLMGEGVDRSLSAGRRVGDVVIGAPVDLQSILSEAAAT